MVVRRPSFCMSSAPPSVCLANRPRPHFNTLGRSSNRSFTSPEEISPPSIINKSEFFIPPLFFLPPVMNVSRRGTGRDRFEMSYRLAIERAVKLSLFITSFSFGEGTSRLHNDGTSGSLKKLCDTFG
ncbi:hypothetical protein AVEN_250862-1 [Araneus ventricosus]|uniref:Uncharacterized protein n=1 Tax=Araneus ventricosus TaxID=182803 RepID=A0A4Y2INJ6_ARAVE|nr:hypothetical protein AVEN_250862-1 [Araneus ventricosus]